VFGLAARLDGFGVEWMRGRSLLDGKNSSSPVVLRLVPESPIHGRVVDLEGRPVSGVQVRVVAQAVPREGQSLDPWLDAVKRGLRDAERQLDELPGYEEEASPPIVSGPDGRFVVRGIGRERMAQLQVGGATIATAQFDVVTRSLQVLADTAHQIRRAQVFGEDFTYQAEPTQPIVGTVRDAVTGKPLAGVRLELNRHKFIGTWTDAEGKFRLVGMPKDTIPEDQEWKRNRLEALPTRDQPYFGNEVDIPQTAGLNPVTLDIKLRRGLWITGRVTDKVTGRPVGAAILHYFPYGSNTLIKAEEWRTIESAADASHRVTQPDGTYRIVGLPVRALVGVRAGGGMYLTGVGASEIRGMDKRGFFPQALGHANAGFESALKEINPPSGTDSVACNFALDPGGNLRILFVDGAGKSVESGFLFLLEPGLAVTWGQRKSPFDLSGLAPSESRTYQITEWKRKIAKVFTFAYDDKKPHTLTVTLEPCATVRGRLLDEEGSPLKNVQVSVSAMENGREKFTLYPFGPVTDADGRFVIENLAAGCDAYKIIALHPQLDFVTVAEKVTYAPGKTIDLGEIKIKRDGSKAVSSSGPKMPTPAPKTQTPNATKPQAAPAAAAASRGSVFNDETPRIIRGTVLRPDGKPAAGAQVLALRRFWSGRGNWRPLATARAGTHGEFEIRVPRQPYDGLGSGFGWLAARAEGFGVQWARGREALDSKPLLLKLVSDSPIHGRVLDLEGRPIRGVRVTVREQHEPKQGQDLASWLSAVKIGSTSWRRDLGDLLPGFCDPSEPPITTNQDGQFTLSGIGAERVVHLRLDGDAIASAEFEVITRPSEPITRSEGPAGPGQVFGNNFTYQAEPTKPVVGTVRDAITGKPLPGIGVESDLRVFIRTKTDAQGRFQLLGMPKAAGSARREGNQIRVMPADDQPYFPDLKDVPQTPGLDPVVIDVKLRRGLWATGRVTEKGTGKPVVARMGYSPFLSNAFAAQVPWFQRNTSSIYDIMHSVSQSDGTFRLLVLPGRGIVSATGLSQSYRTGVGASEIGGMNKDGIFPTYRNSSTVSAKHDHALKEINPSEGTQSVTCDLLLDPGGLVRITLVDRDHKPVDRCTLLYTAVGSFGSISAVVDSQYDLAGLNPNETRAMMINQVRQKIGKVFTLTYDDKAPRALTVTLEPCATVKGRLVDEDGAPCKHLGIFAEPSQKLFQPLRAPISAESDSDGRFVLTDLAPGCETYRVVASGSEFRRSTVAERIAIASGKTIDLGEIKLRSGR
jgi:Carboxypeptidase regulatory-like domain